MPSRRARVPAPLLLVALLLTASACAASPTPDASSSAPFRFVDVSAAVGLGDVRTGAFRDAVTPDPVATMGTGLCWLDADRDGWLDLYVVNTWSEAELGRWREAGGAPRAMLLRNDRGTFVDVSAGSGADLEVRGTGCAAADLDRDGDTDLVVTSAGPTSLLWNDGDGTFTEGGAAAGLAPYGWYAGIAIGDVDGDGWQDVFLAGYADLNAPIEGAPGGFPRTYAGVRDLLFLSTGLVGGRVAFREVGVEAGLEAVGFKHGLGASFGDVDRDGDLDLVVANDLDPDELYENVRWPDGADADPAGLGFRFDEVAAPAGVADPNAGMGVALGDLDRDGRDDLLITNARSQGHLLALRADGPTLRFARAAAEDVPTSFLDATGFGVALADFDRDGDPDLLLANGDVPVESLAADAEPLLFGSAAPATDALVIRDASAAVGLAAVGPLVARGSAVADFDNDGRLDVAIATVGGRVVLLRGTGGDPGWIAVVPSPATPGTLVTVTTADGRRWSCELRAGSSYLSSEDPRCLVGFGAAAASVRVEVVWPDGRRKVLDEVAAQRVVRVWP
ncbi:MAG: CRTAC1 family protein [Actinomycetota bacterium]